MPQRQKLDPIHLDILDLLQRDGGWVTSRALHERLRPSYGHSPAAAKTIQRALQRLLDGGFIEGAGNSSARTWRHLTGRTPNKAEVKSVELAVALLQLEQYAANQLPAQSLQILRDYCDRSRELLHSHPTYPRYVQGRDWRGKTAVIDSSYPLLPPALDEGIMDAITQALYRGTALALRYQNASVPTETPQDYQVSPLALVERGSVLYLVSCRRSRSTGSYVRYLHRVDRITRASATDTLRIRTRASSWSVSCARSTPCCSSPRPRSASPCRSASTGFAAACANTGCRPTRPSKKPPMGSS